MYDHRTHVVTIDNSEYVLPNAYAAMDSLRNSKRGFNNVDIIDCVDDSGREPVLVKLDLADNVCYISDLTATKSHGTISSYAFMIAVLKRRRVSWRMRIFESLKSIEGVTFDHASRPVLGRDFFKNTPYRSGYIRLRPAGYNRKKPRIGITIVCKTKNGVSEERRLDWFVYNYFKEKIPKHAVLCFDDGDELNFGIHNLRLRGRDDIIQTYRLPADMYGLELDAYGFVKLEEPYRSVLFPGRHGTIGICRSSNRRLISIISDDPTTSDSVLLSRYIFQVDYWKKCKRLLPSGYDVDHIDNDKWNDRLDNLQLLHHTDNLKKGNAVQERFRTYTVFICPACGALHMRRGNLARPGCVYPVSFCNNSNCTRLLRKKKYRTDVIFEHFRAAQILLVINIDKYTGLLNKIIHDTTNISHLPPITLDIRLTTALDQIYSTRVKFMKDLPKRKFYKIDWLRKFDVPHENLG